MNYERLFKVLYLRNWFPLFYLNGVKLLFILFKKLVSSFSFKELGRYNIPPHHAKVFSNHQLVELNEYLFHLDICIVNINFFRFIHNHGGRLYITNITGH